MQPITKLAVFKVQFDSGMKFEIFHNLTEKEIGDLFDWWVGLPIPFSEDKFIFFVKYQHPGCICVSKADYDKITKGKAIPATKEEYEVENNKPKGV